MDDRVRALTAWEPPAATSTVHMDRFDAAILDDVIALSPSADEYVQKLQDGYWWANDLARDVGAVFYQPSPRLRDAGELDPRALPGRSLVQAVLESPATEDLRRHTVWDRYATAAAFGAVADTLNDLSEQVLEEAARRGHDMSDAFAKQDALRAAAAGGDPEATEAAADALQAALDALGAAPEGLRAAASAGVSERLREVAEELDAEAEAAAGWGLGDGDLQRLPFEERARLADRFKRSRLRDYVRLIGRLRMSALSERSRRTDFGREEPYTVTLSRNLADVMPQELVALTTPVTRPATMLRFAEGRLLTRKYRGTERVAAGPLVVCVDTSGSMQGDAEGWAKAFTLAVREVALREGRAFACILFSSQNQQTVVDDPTIAGALDIGELFYGGGTDWQTPLDMALDRILGGGAFEKADIVLVTDGVARTQPEWRDQFNTARHELGVRCWGVYVGARTVPGELAAITDDARGIDCLVDGRQVTDLLRTV